MEIKLKVRLSDFALRTQTTHEAAISEEQSDIKILKNQFLKLISLKVARRIKVRLETVRESETVKWKDLFKMVLDEDELMEEEKVTKY